MNYRYLQGDRPASEGHLRLVALYFPHQDCHFAKKQQAKSTPHHGIRPGSTEQTNSKIRLQHCVSLRVCVRMCGLSLSRQVMMYHGTTREHFSHSNQ